MWKRTVFLPPLLLAACSGHAGDDSAIREELRNLKDRVRELERKLADDGGDAVAGKTEPLERARTAVTGQEPIAEAVAEEGIEIGGAVRFQYSFEDYNPVNRDRSGDVDLDTIRLNFDGNINAVILSAEWRYYQYMQVVHHAWVGYQFSDQWQVQLGITKVPFGVLPYNSHNFFFDTTYYAGLEDDYDSGVKLLFADKPWDIRLAFFKNDELGGVDGYVSDRSERYSYDVVGARASGEGIFDRPAGAIGESNTVAGRMSYEFIHGGGTTEVGLSAQRGDLEGDGGRAGEYSADAVHLEGNYGRWNLQLQAARYDYDLDSPTERLAVGAYGFYDTIPATAEIYTANLAYSLPVNRGPVSDLTFYFDNSLMTGKSADLDDTTMNILGMAVAAGGLYTYFDLVSAENQPFIGGSLAGDDGDRNTRFNVNVGYYF